MSSNDPQLAWTDDQWSKVHATVQEAARNARVASSFLPLVGPLPPSDTTVPRMLMDEQEFAGLYRLKIDEHEILTFSTISVNVYLKNSEVTDPDLASALAMFARAADIIARVEDALVFNGTPEESDDDPAGQAPKDSRGNLLVTPRIYRVHGGKPNAGLLRLEDPRPVPAAIAVAAGTGIVRGVIQAVQDLEEQGHYGPFACVLGRELFEDANTPTDNSLVLPSDRFMPFLNGPLLRSSTIPPDNGVVVSLAGHPIELVVATDITVKFLQLTTEPRYVFRVYERIALRVKQEGAVCTLVRSGAGG
jgi:uncharacterized linocin/CFP29 family protein